MNTFGNATEIPFIHYLYSRFDDSRYPEKLIPQLHAYNSVECSRSFCVSNNSFSHVCRIKSATAQSDASRNRSTDKCCILTECFKSSKCIGDAMCNNDISPIQRIPHLGVCAPAFDTESTKKIIIGLVLYLQAVYHICTKTYKTVNRRCITFTVLETPAKINDATFVF